MISPSSSSVTSNYEQNQIKKMYEELAEKEKALIMAAEFGKNLIDEKEDLERQIDCMKRDHQAQVDQLEQELYELKRSMELMRNEYDTKIYDLNEDLAILNRRLVAKTTSAKPTRKSMSNMSNTNTNDFNNNPSPTLGSYVSSRRSLGATCSVITNNNNVDDDDDDDNDQIYDNTHDIVQELTEKNQKLMEELKSNELQFELALENRQSLENKIAEKENIISDDSKVISNFQKEISKYLNKQQELEFMLLQSCNDRDKQAKIIDELTQKYLIIENEKNELENLIIQNEAELYNTQRINQDLLYKLERMANSSTNSANLLVPSLSSAKNQRKRRSSFSLTNTPSNVSHKQDKANASKALTSTAQKASFSNNTSFHSQCANKKNSFYSDSYGNNRSYFGSEYDDDEDVETNHDLDMFKINEIEQDDDDENSVVYFKSTYMDEENDSFELGVNWQQEASEQRLIDNDNDTNDQHHIQGSMCNKNDQVIGNEKHEKVIGDVEVDDDDEDDEKTEKPNDDHIYGEDMDSSDQNYSSSPSPIQMHHNDDDSTADHDDEKDDLSQLTHDKSHEH